MVRRLLVIGVALLLAVQVVRNAAVLAFSDSNPAAAARAWPGNPRAELSLGMTEIGEATHAGRPVGAQTFARIYDAAAKAPLAPEPFLVRGVQAQLSRKMKLAAEAFRAAEARDPRSLSARYFLASYYLQTGDAANGLREFANLARLTPYGTSSVAPYVATYARDRSNWPELRRLFRSDSELEDATLTAMAQDPASAEAILALADREHRTARSAWLPILLKTLVAEGQYGRARAIWTAISGARLGPGQLLYDARFADSDAPDPFNWTLTTSTVGLAERQSGGRLHLLFYGQQDGVLATQLLLLPPGTYRMSMQVSGSQKQMFSWSLTCDKAHEAFATIGFNVIGARPWDFTVPAGCPAQRLDLVGTSADLPQQADVTISGVSLSARRPNA
jgi:hypothetical protein